MDAAVFHVWKGTKETRREGSRLFVWTESDGLFASILSGQIWIRAPHDTDVIVETSSGRVSVDGMASGHCSVHTISGRIRLHHLHGRLSAESVTGTIDIELDSDLEDLGFDLKSVSGSITVGSIRTERGLRMGFGRFLVRGRTISGALAFQ